MRDDGRRFLPAWMRQLAGPFRRNAALAVALGVAASACAALLMFASGYLISRTAQPATTLFMVMVPVAFVQMFGIGRPIARYFERLVSHDWVFRLTSALRKRLFGAIGERFGDPARGMATGEQLELLADDVGHLQNLFLRTALPTVVAMAMYVLAGLFCGLFSPGLGLALLGFGALGAIAAPLLAYFGAKKPQRRAKAARSREYAKLADDVLGAADWVLAGRGGEVLASHEGGCADAAAGMASVRRAVRVAECASAVAGACGAAALAVVAAIAFGGESGQSGYIAAFALGMFPLAEAFALLPQALAESLEHEAALGRLDGVLEAGGAKPRDGRDGRDVPLRPARRDGTALSLEGVSYRYPHAGRDAVDRLSLDVPAGQKVAILGRSGSGKTTFSKLARGALVPDAGTVRVFGMPPARGEGGRPAEIAHISQNPYVFDRTLRENLAIACEGATDARLADALASVGLSEKLASLDRGLDTHIGETGVGFSGGEAHRLALARALVAQSPIVLLDEPFAAVDPATENLLLDTLIGAFSGKTLVVITHHLAQVERFDRVVFMEDGRIVLDGAPGDLMRESPRFAELVAFDRGRWAR